jgi:serine protease inhibitor
VDAVRAINDFGLKALAADGQADDAADAAVAPPTLHLACATLVAGVDDPAREELAQALGLPSGDEAFDKAADACRAPNGAVYDSGGRLWLSASLSMASELKGACERRLGAAPETFVPPGKDLETRVNDWIGATTGGRIAALFTPPAAGAALVIATAARFKDAWRSPFDRNETQDNWFHPLQGEKRLVPMMRRRGLIEHHFDGEAQVHYLEMRYATDGFALGVLVPKSVDAFRTTETRLDGAYLAKLRAGLKPKDVRITMPRTHSKTTTRFAERAEALGLGSLQRGDTTLGRIAPGLPSQGSDLLCAVDVEIDEAGTEAAAAAVSAVPLDGFSGPIGVEADRPHWCFLVHRATGLVLFGARRVA